MKAVKMVIEGGMTIQEAARHLSMPRSTLKNWIKAFEAGKLNDIGGRQRSQTAVEKELARLKQELACVEAQLDRFEKATMNFFNELLPGTRR